jgi:hypothetical protein
MAFVSRGQVRLHAVLIPRYCSALTMPGVSGLIVWQTRSLNGRFNS